MYQHTARERFFTSRQRVKLLYHFTTPLLLYSVTTLLLLYYFTTPYLERGSLLHGSECSGSASHELAFSGWVVKE